MSVDRHEVRRIADLAKLRLDEEEVDRLADEMSRILGHAERLRGLPRAEDESSEADGLERAEDATSEGGGPERAPETVSGGPDPAFGRPDPLARPPESFAPSMRDGFFTVPPPPGVSTGEAEPDEGQASDA